jgi:phospholipid-binding lipoprotein MlaA
MTVPNLTLPQPRTAMRLVLPTSILAATLVLATALGGCAKPPPASDRDAVADFKQTNDPMEPTNRVFFSINNGLDRVIFRPLAVAYRWAVPQTIRTHTHNFLSNLGQPVTLFDDMLATKPRRAGDSFMRFVVNTTIGVGGVFDVATVWGWPAHDSDAGITFALWGIPDGPFLFLPVLGPTNPRDASGFGTDIAMDPLTWIGHGTTVTALGFARYGLSAVDARERVLDDLDKIEAQALDPYATLRSLSRQHRASQIDDARNDNRATVPAWFPEPAAQPSPSP